MDETGAQGFICVSTYIMYDMYVIHKFFKIRKKNPKQNKKTTQTSKQAKPLTQYTCASGTVQQVWE